MGANAQTSVPDFTAGQVLTAAQMTEVNTGIPVFATSVERDAAFGGTGEKTLAEGQYAYLESTKQTQFYDGAAWQTIGGLSLIVPQTSVSAVAAITIDGCFTSAYTNYLIIANLTSSAGNNFFYRFRAGGVTTSTNYGNSTINQDGATIAGGRTTAQTSGSVGALRAASENSIPMYIYSPQVAQWSKLYTSFLDTVTSTTFIRYDNLSVQTTTTQFDGITFFCSVANISGNYTVYGFNK